MIELAEEMAGLERYGALAVLLQGHSDELRHERLHVLAAAPETSAPSLYASLLTEVVSDVLEAEAEAGAAAAPAATEHGGGGGDGGDPLSSAASSPSSSPSSRPSSSGSSSDSPPSNPASSPASGSSYAADLDEDDEPEAGDDTSECDLPPAVRAPPIDRAACVSWSAEIVSPRSRFTY